MRSSNEFPHVNMADSDTTETGEKMGSRESGNDVELSPHERVITRAADRQNDLNR